MKIGPGHSLHSLMAILAAFGGAPLVAETTTGTMTISATVEESCELDARPMVFGTLTAEHGSIDARSSVVLACTPTAGYVVTMDDGGHSAGGTRRMVDASGTSYIAYEIYSDAARTRRWGSTAMSGVSGVASVDGRVELEVYARLAAGRALAGAYGDTVTVTIEF